MREVKGWKVTSYVITFGRDGERRERLLDDLTKSERDEMGKRMNLRALRAAGYVPVGAICSR